MTWQEHYGFKTGPFRGIVHDASGNRIDTTRESIDAATGTNYGIGFGPGDLRKARGEGWTALSILEYLKGTGTSEHGLGGYGAASQSQYARDTGGRGVVPQEVINELRQDQRMQAALRTAYENRPDPVDTSNFVTQGALDTTIGNLPNYSNQIEDITQQQSANTLAIAANQAAANNAMAAANQVNTPFAVTGNSAMQIQSVPSSNQLAGQIATGLGGLSRNQRRFQNTTLNV